MNTYRRIRADPADWFDAEQVAKAKAYQRPMTRFRLVWRMVELVVVLVLISTHAVPRIADALGATAWPMRLLVAVLVLQIVDTILEQPYSIWMSFVHDRKWGFSTETPKGYVADLVKGFFLSAVLFGVLFGALWAVIRATDMWWLAGWAVFFLFSVVLAFLLPIVIMPIFNKFTPLNDADLATRLRALAESVGMRVREVEVMDASKRTRKDNAFFAGLGRSRKIVVFDNLLEQPPAFVASVVAHELGHFKLRHIRRGLVLGTVTSLLLFVAIRLVAGWDGAMDWAGVESIRDPAVLPLVLLVFIAAQVLTGFVQSWISRAHERQADLEGLDLTNDYESFVGAMKALFTKDLVDLAPNRWQYIRLSHPPPAERLALGMMWLHARGSRTTTTGEPA